MPTLRDIFKEAREVLASDAEVDQILSAVWSKHAGKELPSRLELYSRMAEVWPDSLAKEALHMARARAGGAILQHLTGVQTFLDHIYEVTPDVLVPRPETEMLARAAQTKLRSPALGLEVGVGSGILSIELLSFFPELRVLASEHVVAAAEAALRNSRRILGESSRRLEIVMTKSSGDVLEPFAQQDQKAEFLISNPPYLQQHDPIESDVRSHEPATALFAPEGDPVYFYRKIAEGAPALLKPGGWVFVEVPSFRAQEILNLFESLGWICELEQDLGGEPRVISARLKA